MEKEEDVALSEPQSFERSDPRPATAASLPALIFNQIELNGSDTILRKKTRGIWQPMTWKDLGIAIRDVGMALRAIGLRQGEVACILAETSPQWAMADLGIQSAHGISAGLSTTDTLAQIQATLVDCRCRTIFIDNEEQLDKLLQIRAACPDLQRIVIFNVKGLRDFDDPMCESFANFSARGRNAEPGAWEAGLAAIGPADGAVLTYTSGISGSPKGVVLSHRGILAQIAATAARLGQHAGDERLAFLPMSHFMERILGLYQALHAGTVSNYVESAETVRENLREVMPTVLYAPPRVWERLHARVTIAARDATALQRMLYRGAIAAGQRCYDARREGRQPTVLQRAAAALGSALVLRNVRRLNGIDRVRIGGVGGAPVSPDLLRWFGALGIDLVELYGLSETAGVVAAIDAGGKAQPLAACGDLKLSPSGEVLVRGDHVFSGYWRAGTLQPRDGAADWYATGDTAVIDGGRLRLTGRADDAIATGSGLTASQVELALKFSPYIADTLVFGAAPDGLCCLVMIDPENVEKWAQDQKVTFTGFTSLVRHDAVRGLIDGEIQRANARLAQPIRSFRLIEQRLEAEDPELSPMMKLRRQFVSEKYRNLIDDMSCDARLPAASAAKMAQRQ
jgi:long-chain acyl-CoA synthetase